MGKIDTPDPREVKLPVWAKDLLNNARRCARDAEKENMAARLATDPAGSDMIIERYASSTPIGLGRRPTVRVILERATEDSTHDGRYVDVRLTDDGKAVELMASGPLQIRPQITNVIQIWPTR